MSTSDDEYLDNTIANYNCCRCQGSGEIGVDIRGRFERAGPVPDDAKGYAIATCPACKGTGYVEMDDSHE